jgi:peptidylprolyl isomerase
MMKTLIALAAATVFAGGAAAQKPSEEDLKPDLVMPKMTAPSAVAAPKQVTDEDVLLLDLSSGGRVSILMRPDIAPKHIERIRTLVRQHFYDGTVFHRVIEGFMAQGGDPTATGTGGSKLPDLKAEFNDLPHVRGAVAMARAGSPDSANSQFYIVLQPVLKLDHNYTVWGRVTGGMDYVDAIERGEPPANPTKILQASLAADHVPPPAPSTPIPAVQPAAAADPALLTPPGETIGAVPAKAAAANATKKPGKKK